MVDKNLYKRILTLQAYSKIEHNNPYVIHLKNNKQELIFFGVDHSRNPKDAEYQRIGELFKSLIDSHSKRKIIVLLENFIPPRLFKTSEEMIKSFGESGFVYYIAKKSGIAVICPEPKSAEILKIAASVTNKKIEIAAWALLNSINWRLKENNHLLKEDIEATKKVLIAINKSLKMLKRITPEKLFAILSLKINFEAKRNILPSSLNDLTTVKLNSKLIKNLQNPFINQTKINNAGAEVNRARDYFIARSIIKQIKSGKSVFAVFGSDHVVCQEKVIRKYFKK